MVYCSIKWCGKNTSTSNYTADGISFHRFPMDPKLRKKWVELSRRENWAPSKASTVCSRHFTEDCFHVMKDGRRRLFNTAIPSKHLPILGDATTATKLKLKSEKHDRLSSITLNCNQSTMEKSSTSDMPMLVVQPLTKKQTSQPLDSSESGNKILCRRILELSGKVKLRNRQLMDLRSKVRYYQSKVASLNEIVNELRDLCPVKAENEKI